MCSLFLATKTDSARLAASHADSALVLKGVLQMAKLFAGVLVSALHPRSVGVVTDSFRPLVMKSGDEPT